MEIETGKSDVRANIEKLRSRDIDRIVAVATSPNAVGACRRVIDEHRNAQPVELLTWLDVS